MEKEAKSCLKQWLGSIWVWSPFEKGFMMNSFGRILVRFLMN